MTLSFQAIYVLLTQRHSASLAERVGATEDPELISNLSSASSRVLLALRSAIAKINALGITAKVPVPTDAAGTFDFPAFHRSATAAIRQIDAPKGNLVTFHTNLCSALLALDEAMDALIEFETIAAA